MANHPPSPPTDVELNGVPAAGEMTTRDLSTVKVSAKVDDPDANQKVRLVALYTPDYQFKTDVKKVYNDDYKKQGVRRYLNLTGLKANTKYYVRLYTQDSARVWSNSYSSVVFWTNRPPTAELVQPRENAEYALGQTILFDWKFNDPDAGDSQTAYQLRYMPLNTPGATWKVITRTGSFLLPDAVEDLIGTNPKNTFLTLTNPVASPRFRANTNYIWSVRVADEVGVWSEWAVEQSFFIRGTTTPPTPLDPVGGIGKSVVASLPYVFTWKFRDPSPGTTQTKADIRWRVVNANDLLTDDTDNAGGWFVTTGTTVTPGNKMQWEISANTFQAGFIYEWQVRTYDSANDLVSNWSTSGQFVAAVNPGSFNTEPLFPDVDSSEPLGSLGCGTHRVFVYYRGGKVPVGEIKPLAHVQWSRLRDDIANALITTNGFGQDCCELLGSLRSWIHEIVIYRDNERVFEGPVTRITYSATDVEIEAKDVMAYLYRRIMRQGYDDRLQRIDLTPKTPPSPGLYNTKGGPYTIIGQNVTVVQRAVQIAMNALGYLDPNVLGYITPIHNAGDATEQRLVYDYGRTAWEEIDDMAATAGLDYTTVGRRIIFWDTHRSIGRLPEMRDGDFEDPVIVTEYGMQTANYFGVTNNSGVWGAAYPLNMHSGNWHESYGPVEMLASAYGENEAPKTSTESLNRAAHKTLVENLARQARASIAHRWPTPVVARVPDNSRLNPDVGITIQQLVPGVWIPLRATLTCRNVSQWQKLDSVIVTEEEGVEKVQVTMSPAPHGGDDDPDKTGQQESTS